MAKALAALVVLALVLVAPATALHAGCGTGHPSFGGDEEPVQSPQEYQSAPGRRTADAPQTYNTGTGGAFVPIATAHANGQTAPIRVRLVWDLVQGGDYSEAYSGAQALQCTKVGGTIRVPCKSSSSSSCLEAWKGCSAADVVTVGSTKLEAMQSGAEWAAQRLAKALYVKPVQNAITLSTSVRLGYNVNVTTIDDADVVIIMGARPSPYVPVAGYARCLQNDQYGRCTVGFVNWVPSVVISNESPTLSAVESERHTMLHEMVHVLGGMGPSRMFIDDHGNIAASSSVYQTITDAFGKPSTWIVTPRVQKLARAHFGCDDLAGMPLEDLPLGKGVHWEARVAGPELMSYGTPAGEVTLSDFTLAFLEDSNQYVANYTMAGPLVDVGTPSVDGSLDWNEGYKPPAAWSPGALRWGRGQGCDFVRQSPALWPSRYTCNHRGTLGCTPDNRLSAVCEIIPNWSLDTTGQYSCGSWSSPLSSAQCTVTNDNCKSGACGLPSTFQYVTDDTAAQSITGSSSATKSTTGGYSAAMDYAFVNYGLWNCQYSKTAHDGNATGFAEGAQVNLIGTLIGRAPQDASLFGGQARCPNCRCFVSSLMELSSSSFDPSFPAYGLCYRANCFKEDYLQFGIMGQFGETFWYKCPSEGGKMYIAGFSGAFHCPVAKEFCAQETITGIKYQETDPLVEWIIWGCVTGGVVMFALLCMCSGSFRSAISETAKFVAGVDHFHHLGHMERLEDELEKKGRVVTLVPGRRRSSVSSATKPTAVTPIPDGLAEPPRRRSETTTRRPSDTTPPPGVMVNNEFTWMSNPSHETPHGVRRPLPATVTPEVRPAGPLHSEREQEQEPDGERIFVSRPARSSVVGTSPTSVAARRSSTSTTSASPVVLATAQPAGPEQYNGPESPVPQVKARYQRGPRRSSAECAPRATSNVPWTPSERPPRRSSAETSSEFNNVALSQATHTPVRRESSSTGSVIRNDAAASSRRRSSTQKDGRGAESKTPAKGEEEHLPGAPPVMVNVPVPRRSSVESTAKPRRPSQAAQDKEQATQEVLQTLFTNSVRRRSVFGDATLTASKWGDFVRDFEELAVKAPDAGPAGVITFVSVLFLVFALLLLVLSVIAISTGALSSQGFALLCVSLALVTLALLGYSGARIEARGASCAIVTYFYVMLVALIALAFVVVWAALFTAAFSKLSAETLNVVVAGLLAVFGLTNTIFSSTAWLYTYWPYAIPVVAVVMILMLAAVIAAFRAMTMNVLMSTLFTLGTYALFVVGAVLIGTTSRVMFYFELFGQSEWWGLLVTLWAIIICFMCIVGIFGAFRKKSRFLKLYLLFLMLTLCVVPVIAWLLATAQSLDLSNIDENTLASLAGSAGATAAGVGDYVQNVVRTLIVALILFGLLLLVLLQSGWFFVVCINLHAEVKDLDIYVLHPRGCCKCLRFLTQL